MNRLGRPVRDRADAFCDACGSSQPRILYGLKDKHGDRYYFVGQSCLQELVRLEVISRTFGRQSAASAYQDEMQRRLQEREKSKITLSSNGKRKGDTQQEAMEPSVEAETRSTQETQLLCPAVLITEGSNQYRAWISLLSAGGTILAWGYAEEDRYEEVWRGQLEGGFLLERVKQERSDALGLCLARAWKVATSQIEETHLVPLQLNEAVESSQGQNLPLLLAALTGLAAKVSVPIPSLPTGSSSLVAPARVDAPR